MKNKRRSNKYLSVITGVVVVVIIAALCLTGAFEKPDPVAWDFFQRTTSPLIEANSQILMVAIDQAGLDTLASWGILWPWPRDLWGRLLEIADSAGASGVLFDILFDDPGIDRLDSDGYGTDYFLAQNLQRNIPSIIASFLYPGEYNSAEIPEQAFWDGVPLQAYHSSGSRVRLPHERFHNADIALVNAFPDKDGVIRSVPPLCSTDQDTFPTMPFKMAVRLRGDELVLPPLDRHGRMWLRYYGHAGPDGAFEYVPAATLIAGMIPPETLKGKILIVGGYASGLLDYKATPLTSIEYPYPGFEIHATMLSNLLQQDWLMHLNLYWQALITLLLGILGIAILRLISRLWLQILFLILFGGFYFGLALLLFNAGYLLPVVAPLTSCYLGVGIFLFTDWQLEGRQRMRLHKLFSRYLDNSVIEDLMERSDDAFMLGEERLATIMFTDMVGFTTASEKLSPQEVVAMLNAYHSEFVEIALKHRGMLDKYVGDAVMIVFGVAEGNTAHEAALTLLEAQAAFDKLSRERKAQELPVIDVCLGVHTDNIILGNIGHPRRMDYTSIGSGVNLASRLEGATRHMATRNLVSEVFVERLPEDIHRREIGTLVVKGANEPMRVFELIPGNEVGEWLDEWEKGWQLFHEGHRKEAVELFKTIIKIRPDDRALKRLIERLEKKIASGSIDESEVLETK